jgi:hypothetical protein
MVQQHPSTGWIPFTAEQWLGQTFHPPLLCARHYVWVALVEGPELFRAKLHLQPKERIDIRRWRIEPICDGGRDLCL